jgi:hypothetical protein
MVSLPANSPPPSIGASALFGIAGVMAGNPFGRWWTGGTAPKFAELAMPLGLLVFAALILVVIAFARRRLGLALTPQARLRQGAVLAFALVLGSLSGFGFAVFGPN